MYLGLAKWVHNDEVIRRIKPRASASNVVCTCTYNLQFSAFKKVNTFKHITPYILSTSLQVYCRCGCFLIEQSLQVAKTAGTPTRSWCLANLNRVYAIFV
jgi:hypothetical protein